MKTIAEMKVPRPKAKAAILTLLPDHNLALPRKEAGKSRITNKIMVKKAHLAEAPLANSFGTFFL